MKNNYRKLGIVLEMLDIEFYTARCDKYNVNLMARFSPENAVKLIAKKFNSVGFDLNGFADFTRYNIKITLT